MRINRDRKFLQLLAKAAYQELRRRHIGKPFRLAHKVSILSTNTNGWVSSLGSFVGYKCSADVWIDRFTGYSTRKVYYALYSEDNRGLADIAKLVRGEFGNPLNIYMKDLDQEIDYTCLRKRLSKIRFGRPVYERYRDGSQYYYGIYEYDRTGLQKNEFNRLVERIADFFQSIARMSADEVDTHDYDNYKGTENRQSVVRHIQRERKSHAATLCKQRDNFICQVCRFDFAKKYGSLGEDFAEAHHIVPLGKNKTIRSTMVDDLITVCANCHRMLHRMNGTKNDIKALRRIVSPKNGR